MAQLVDKARGARAIDAHLKQFSRVGENRFRGVAKKDRSLVEHEQEIGVVGEERDLLLDHHDGRVVLLRVVFEQLEDTDRRDRIELCGRFIEYEHTGLERDDGCERHLLLLTSGKAVDRTIAQGFDAHRFERGGKPVFDLILRHPEILESVEDLIFDNGRDHLAIDVLANAADQTRDAGKVGFDGIKPAYVHRAVEIAWIAVGDDAVECVGER